MADEPTNSPTDEELLDQFRQLRVSDLLAQTATMLVSLAEGKLQTKELDEARLAIDALRALAPVLAEAVPPEFVRDLNQVVANLQLAYAKAVAGGPAPAAGPEPPPT